MSIDIHGIRRAVLDHVDACFDRHRKELLRTRAIAGLPDLRVARITEPNNPVEPIVMLTFGAWEAGKDRDEASEWMLLVAADDPIHLHTLADVVERDARAPIARGATIPLGRSWVAGATCDHLLVTAPYAYGEALERVDTGDLVVNVRWLVPITRAEAEYAQKHGAEALELMLQAAAVDFLAIVRPSAV